MRIGTPTSSRRKSLPRLLRPFGQNFGQKLLGQSSGQKGLLGAAALVGVLGLVVAAPATAIQFTPDSDDRLNTFASGDPGSPFDTGPDGVDFDAVGSAEPHPGEVVVDGNVPTLNFFDGTSQDSITFGTAIEFTLEAELISAALVSVGGGDVQYVATFESTADGQPDLVVTDPTDSTVLLEANLVGGTLNGNPVDPITVFSQAFDPNSPPTAPALQAFVFFQTVVSGNPWEILFSDDVGTLNDSALAQSLVSNFDPSFDVIANELDSTGVLPSHTAEANGTVFALDSSQFVVPEPGTAWLVAVGVAGLLAMRRRLA